MTYSTRIVQPVEASAAAVYRALTDPEAVSIWMVPDGMRSQVHTFEAHEGGRFRISLTYESLTEAGKTTAHTDTYHGYFAVLVPGVRVMQVLDFETADPMMQGQMTITFELEEVAKGTVVHAEHSNVPAGINPADNETGWRMSLEKLAALVERRQSGD